MIEFCRQIPFSMFTHKGTPRWLIRGSFSRLLPGAFLEPWEQHGVLNIDWIERVKRDWHTIKPELTQHLSSDYGKDWIAKDRLQSYLDVFETASDQTSSVFAHLCAMEGLYRFRHPEEK